MFSWWHTCPRSQAQDSSAVSAMRITSTSDERNKRSTRFFYYCSTGNAFQGLRFCVFVCLFFFWQCVLLYGHFMQLSTYPVPREDWVPWFWPVLFIISIINLSTTWENVSSDMYAKQRLKSACASTVWSESSFSAWKLLHFRLSKMRPMRISIRLRQCWAYMFEVTLPDVVALFIHPYAVQEF